MRRVSLFLLLLPALCCAAQQPLPTQPVPTVPAASGHRTPTVHSAPLTLSEHRASQAFIAARDSGPLALHAFLARMPKGADLHMHLSGAVYAETFLADAARDNLCVDPVHLTLLRGPASTQPAACTAPDVPATSIFHNQQLYNALVDSFSMRGFVPTPGTTGHDQFFATFDRFGGLGSRHAGEWLDELATRAAAQNEQYLEVMQTPDFSEAIRLADRFGWPGALRPATTAATSQPGDLAGTTPAELSALRDKLLASGLRETIAANRAEFASALANRNSIEQCGTASALPACSVQIRFLYQVLRSFPPQQVFAQTLLAFEVAAQDPNVVGLNFVQPEDNYLAMSEYHRQMLMLDYLHSVYPHVHISLHAGELAPGLVPPAGLRFHIRQAVDLGHAERIGHGVDVMDETDPNALLAELAARHIMVEINLTSNDVILGVSANHHSLPSYRAAHVPVALSTDDEGVSRIDLTHEYVRAATDFHLDYPDLKRLARTSLEHSFLQGQSLWLNPDDFSRPIAVCASQPLGAENPNTPCLELLRASQRAAQQWELEHRFRIFESTLPN